MKVIIVSVGTRGDMEPFLAIGEILKEHGCHVICAFPEQFRGLAVEANMEFHSLGSKFIELLETDAGKAALGGRGSGLRKMLAYIKLALRQTGINKELVHRQSELIDSERPDRIVYNGKAVYPILWGLENRGKTILVSPVPYLHYVKNNTHVAFNSNFGPFLNKLTYSLANFGLITTVRITAKWLNISRKIPRKQIKNALRSNRVIYTISPTLFPRPGYWNENLKVLGYPERNRNVDWHPNEALRDFLAKHPRILFITFGSMTNPDPAGKTELIVDLLERNNIPAIINTASGGLYRPDKFNTGLLYFVSGIPYDWIFPKSYAVIHHGGSGTTHLALKYGCATMIVPHIIDQFVWNRILHNLGVGPKGIRINKISAKNLEPKILELMSNPAFKKNAEEIARRMGDENFREEVYKSIIG